MNDAPKTNLVLGAAIVLAALLLMFVWIPLDVDTGVVERVRRQTVIGDALAPLVAGAFLLIGGAMLILFERREPVRPAPHGGRAVFVLAVAATLALAFLVMRYAGPAAVALLNPAGVDDPSYRALRGTFPWKYMGFFLGCTFAISGVMALTERRLSGRAVVLGVAAALVLIAIFDLPFDDLLLPPNGDV